MNDTLTIHSDISDNTYKRKYKIINVLYTIDIYLFNYPGYVIYGLGM